VRWPIAAFESLAVNSFVVNRAVGESPCQIPRMATLSSAGSDVAVAGGVTSTDGVCDLGHPDSLRALVSARQPLVEPFVVAQSAVVRTALEDDPTSNWIFALPPFTADFPFERCIDLLGALERLYGQSVLSLDPFRICRIRNEPLFPVLAGSSDSDLAQLRLLTEYLQLPKELAGRLDLHGDCLTQLGKSEAAGDGRLSDYICGSAALNMLLNDTAVAAVAAALGRGGRTSYPLAAIVGRRTGAARQARLDALRSSHFLPGLCGDSLPPGSTPEERALHVAGLVAAKHPFPADPPPVGMNAPACVAAGLGRVEELAALAAAGWWLCLHATARAAAHGQIAVLDWLADNGRFRPAPTHGDWSIAEEAAAEGQLLVLQWIHDKGHPLPPTVATVAVEGGYTDIIDWLATLGWNWHTDLCTAAAGMGHLLMLQRLRAHGCPLASKAMQLAAGRGYLDIVQWLAAQPGAPAWNAEVCAAAAFCGRLDLLQWLRGQEPPCPWDASTISTAQACGHAHVVAWAIAHGCPDEAR